MQVDAVIPDHVDPFLADLSADVGTLGQRVDQLDGSVDEMANDLRTHEIRLDNQNDDISTLMSTCLRLQAEVDRLTELVEHAQEAS